MKDVAPLLTIYKPCMACTGHDGSPTSPTNIPLALDATRPRPGMHHLLVSLCLSSPLLGWRGATQAHPLLLPPLPVTQRHAPLPAPLHSTAVLAAAIASSRSAPRPFRSLPVSRVRTAVAPRRGRGSRGPGLGRAGHEKGRHACATWPGPVIGVG